ncbi:MAG: 2OG-Fe(II) oxygenase [Planctomycetales bacterium]|nr:2OG-Fe(II) oxygenase [Planctomycetales bacterium]
MRKTKQDLSRAETDLLDTIGELSDSISFCTSGTRPLILPGLDVAGVGEIALPVSKADARRIIKQANQAPYGRGEDTIVDTDVRRVWQLEPDQFELNNPKWPQFVRGIVSTVKSEFAITQKVTTSLYKLLIYEKGSFFVPHRDTEKAHRMFATLVICLPSKHEGGQLIVSHGGQSKVINFSDKTAAYDLQYAAFYADCEHEVQPVTDGYRFCLVYNLATTGKKAQPTAPEFGGAIEAATREIQAIFKENKERDMLILPLAHQYSEAGLTPDETDDGDYDPDDSYDDDWDDDDDDEFWDSADDDDDDEFDEDELDNKSSTYKAVLRHAEKSPEPSKSASIVPLEFKGGDKALTDVLGEAATQADCRAFVALLTQWQSGCPDYGTIDFVPYGYRGRYGSSDLSDGNRRAEFEEVYDESLSLKHWHTLDGKRQPFEELTINEDDIVSAVPQEERNYRQEIHEATGNEGMSMERWYHEAVVVVWPEARHFHVLASQGSRNSVPALHDLINAADAPEKCKDCKSFATQILECWNRSTRYRGDNDSLGTSMMRSLLAINDSKLAVKFFDKVLPLEYCSLDGETLVSLAELAHWKQIEQPLARFFRTQKADDYQTGLKALASVFGALASVGDRPSAARKRVCKAVLGEVTQMMQRWEKKTPSSYRNEFIGTVAPLIRGICAVGTKKNVSDLINRIGEKPKHYDLHSVLIPAVNELASDDRFKSSAKLAETALQQLRQFCVDQLTQRTETKPTPPKNWKRPAALKCNCSDCQELAKFLKDKDAQVYRFARRKDLRQHLHRQIHAHRIDCAHVTERRGSPHTLVCTKNQASFERALKQYETDCELLTELSDG